MITQDRHSSRKDGYVSVSENTYIAWLMTVLSLKTELDVARLLLAEGWFPEDINGILTFPLPRAAFHHLGIKNGDSAEDDVIKATPATPTTLYRARQLLESAGWLDRELDSLLKPGWYSLDPWVNQTIHDTEINDCSKQLAAQSSLGRYRLKMALKRMTSLVLLIMMVAAAVVLFG